MRLRYIASGWYGNMCIVIFVCGEVGREVCMYIRRQVQRYIGNQVGR